MEKFGIFELLDALAALTAPDSAPKESPSLQDSAYLPPVYNAEPQPAEEEKTPPEAPRPEQDALAGFYARHDAVAKKAGKKR